MFAIDQEDFILHDMFWGLGPFGGDAGFVATRPISAGADLDASWQATEDGDVVFALVVTVTPS